MSLEQLIKVNTHYTRSVNIERDKDSLASINAYIPTSRAIRTLARVADVSHADAAPRAWSLVGPYGSGKSAFALFLSQLLAADGKEGHKAALKVLNKADKNLGQRFSRHIKGGEGYIKVLVTGSPEPMGRRIVQAVAEAAAEVWSSRKGKKPAVIADLERAGAAKDVANSDVVKLVKRLQVQIAKIGGNGLLLVIDELGKFLEFEARHYGANDIFLLQSLAELACEGHEANLMLFVLLHQSFEQYAKGLGESLKNEWSKVQGRFEEVPFLESSEQVLRVVSAAFEQDFDAKHKAAVKKAVSPIVKMLHETKALPAAMTLKDAEALFMQCYPLHPVSALLLPMLCQKIAQNERTLFSYLGSHEDHGFQSELKSLNEPGDFVLPSQVFDYFVTNQSSVMGDYLTHRRWAEVITALDRLEDVNEEQVGLLKTIGILNIIGSRAGFKASIEILTSVMPSQAAFTRATKALKAQSVINFRRFSGEYRVWQGSDFDLEAALEEELQNL
ncbi:MAG: hypothetical protein ACPG5T_03715, partial [Endozoicomonas sp.]